MKLSIAALTLLPFLPCCGGQPIDETNLSSVAFPTFEPFFASRKWNVLEESRRPGPTHWKTLSDELSEALEFLRRMDSYGLPLERMALGDSERMAKAEAMMEEMRLGIRYSSIPSAFLQLEPLWGKGEWTEDELRYANLVVELIREVDPEQTFDFGEGSGREPSAELRHLVAWFHEQVADPRTYGRMVSRAGMGPWLPIPLESDEGLTVLDKLDAGEGFELDLCERSGGGWCLAGRSGNEVQWVHLLKEIPGCDPGTFSNAFTFTGEPPTPLGPYGSKIHMRAGEAVTVYLSPEKGLLFYITSLL